MELRMRENHVLVLPVNILTVWHAGFNWPHDTLPFVLTRKEFSNKPYDPSLVPKTYSSVSTQRSLQ